MGSREALSLGTRDRPPVLFPKEYGQWKARFLDFIMCQENGDNIMESLLKGNFPKPIQMVDGQEVPFSLTRCTVEVQERIKGDKWAKTYMIQGITNDIFDQIDSHSASAKEMFDKLKELMTGSEISDHLKVSNLLRAYEEFKALEEESLEETFRRFEKLLNEINKVNMNRRPVENNMKFLSILQPEWKKFANPLKHDKNLGLIPLHVVYETLMQNTEEVNEKKEKMKKNENKGKLPAEQIAFMTSRQDGFYSNESHGTDFETSESDKEYSDLSSFDKETADLMQNMVMLTNAFQKRFYNRPGSNNQRFSSGPRNFEHKKNFQGGQGSGARAEEERRFYNQGTGGRNQEERKFVPQGRGNGAFAEQRMVPQAPTMVQGGEKRVERTDDNRKCYNCGAVGHFARECPKPIVRNADYYRNKMQLAEKREAGTALLAEDDHWLDMSDDESNNVESANMCLTASVLEESTLGDSSTDDAECLMGHSSQDETSTSGREVHLSSFEYDNFMSQMNDMMLALHENQNVVENLKMRNKQLNKDLTMECGLNRLHSEYEERKNKEFKDLSKYFNCEINKLTDRTEEAERKRNVAFEKFEFLEKNKEILEQKVCQLEKKLYARDQSDQTIHLNKPKEFQFFNSKWGIGYHNPKNFAKSVKLVPTLYDFHLMDIGTQVPALKLKWTEMSEEDREKEEIRRNESTKMKLPFCYDTLVGDTYDKRIPTNPKTLSNDYFHSYSTTELEAQPIEGKLYVPPLILESKIVQLEEQLEINQYIFEIEKDFLMTILLNHESDSFSKLEDIPESNESILSDSDASSCKAFIGSSILKDVSFVNNTNEPSISSSNGKASVMDDSSESDIFNDCLDSCLFDFNTTLPDHNSFLFNTKEIPSECCKGESSKTNGKVVPETSLKTEGKTKRKSRKRSKKKKSVKPSTQFTNFPKHHSPRSYPNPFDSKAFDIPVFKRVHMVWKVKGSTPEKDAPKSSVPKTPFSKNNVPQGKSFVKPTPIYSGNHLIRLARKQICCSYCGTNDFVQKDYVQYWYGTYRVPSNRAPPNKPGPKFRWVPKSA